MTTWLLTLLGLLIVLTFDFAFAWRKRNIETTMSAATAWTMFYVSLAVIFGLTLGFWTNTKTQSAFFAGWLTEYSLSFDNLFAAFLIAPPVPRALSSTAYLISIPNLFPSPKYG